MGESSAKLTEGLADSEASLRRAPRATSSSGGGIDAYSTRPTTKLTTVPSEPPMFRVW